MNEIGDDLFARAALAGDQDGDVARRDALDGAHHVLHRLLRKIGEVLPLIVSSARRKALFSSFCSLRSRAHFTSPAACRSRTLGQKIVSPAAARFHRHLDRALAGEHDDLRVRPAFF